jgi:precorrin-6B methylase 2
MGLILERSPSADFGDGTASLALEWIWNDQHSKDWAFETSADLDDRMVQRFALASLFYSTNGLGEDWLDPNEHEYEWKMNTILCSQ